MLATGVELPADQLGLALMITDDSCSEGGGTLYFSDL